MTRLMKFVVSVFKTIFETPVSGNKSALSILIDWGAAMYAEFMLIVMRRVESDFAPRLKPLIEKAEKTGKVPPEVQSLLTEIKNPTAPIGALLANSVGGGATGGIVSSTLGPWLLLLQYEIQRAAIQARFDPMTGLAVKFRRPDKRQLVESDLKDLGWSEERSELLEDVAKMRLTEDFLVALRLRNIIPKDQYATRMHHLGYDEKEAEDYYTASLQYPGVSDLVRMAVREAFSPEIAEKFGQYQDLPQKFLEYAKQIGLPDDFAKAFWAAHWDLPSPNMGFEMLHRGIISQEDLKLLLRALDIMPYWRDRMIQLSYSPYTRVDIRRMHKLGILTRDQVKKSYQDIGYDPEKAEAMTKFTEQLNAGTATDAEKELSKAEILKAFKERLYTQEEAEEALRELGYDDASIWLLLTMSQEQAALKTRDLTLSQVKDLYQKGLRTKLDCSAFLSAFGYDANEITALYDLWDWESPQADRLPSRTDFDNFVAAGIITLQEWSDGYTALGYDLKYQEWYFAYLVEKGKIS